MGLNCCQAPRRICCGCDSSPAGLRSVFSLSQIGGMSADFQTQPVGPAIHYFSAVHCFHQIAPFVFLLGELFIDVSVGAFNILFNIPASHISFIRGPPPICGTTSALWFWITRIFLKLSLPILSCIRHSISWCYHTYWYSFVVQMNTSMCDMFISNVTIFP